MPQKLLWTPWRDTALLRLRGAGMSWDRICELLRVSRNAAIERGKRLGARLPLRMLLPEPEDPDREALPAGHPVTWGAVTGGTLLEGEGYPVHGRLTADWAPSQPIVEQPCRPFTSRIVSGRPSGTSAVTDIGSFRNKK